MNRTSTFTAKRSSSGLVKAIFQSLLLTVLVGGGLLFLLTALAMRFKDPARLVLPCGYGALVLTALFCGWTAARKTKGSFFSGVIAGAFLALLLFIIGLCFRVESTLPMPFSILFYPAILPISGLGGFWGRKRSPKRRHVHR